MVTGAAALGETDIAFELLHRAIDQRTFNALVWVPIDPVFAPLREDPRWDDLTARWRSLIAVE